jgi:hypothetical protein
VGQSVVVVVDDFLPAELQRGEVAGNRSKFTFPKRWERRMDGKQSGINNVLAL